MSRYYTKITIGGVDYTDDEVTMIRCTPGFNDRVGKWNTKIRNINGKYKTTFSVGDDVIIYVDGNNPSTTKVFRGIIENVKFQTFEQDEYVLLSGGDYMAYLKDRIVQQRSYASAEVSTIITDLIDNEVDGITTTNVAVTSTTLARYEVRNKSVFDALRELSDLSEFDFWIDTDNDLNWVAENVTSSGVIVDNNNLVGTATFSTDRDDMFNDVWFYGGKYLIGWKEDFGISSAGSVVTLAYKPRNTYVTVNTIKKEGYPARMSVTAPSGTDYLVDYDNKQLVFLSGALFGSSFLASGDSVSAEYKRDRAIVKNSFDQTSIDTYGKRVRVINEKSVTDPDQAKEIVLSELALHKDPKKMSSRLLIQGTSSLQVGNTVIVDIPNQNINSETFKILSLDYNIDKRSMLKNQVVSVTAGQRIKNFSDSLADAIREVRKLQSEDVNTSSTFTRLMQGAGSVGVEISKYELKTRTLGSGWLVGSSLPYSYVGSTPTSAYVGSAGGTQFGIVRSGGTYV